MVIHQCIVFFLLGFLFYYYLKVVCYKYNLIAIILNISVTNVRTVYSQKNVSYCLLCLQVCINYSPVLLFCWLRKSLVGFWKGYFNRKRCKRKIVHENLASSKFCKLFDINKFNNLFWPYKKSVMILLCVWYVILFLLWGICISCTYIYTPVNYIIVFLYLQAILTRPSMGEDIMEIKI